MTNAQMTLMIRLAGGLDEALAACEAAGFEMVKNCGKSAKEKDLLSVPTKDASEIISSLGRPLASHARPLASHADRRDNLVSESAEIDGYMHDRGEDN